MTGSQIRLDQHTTFGQAVTSLRLKSGINLDYSAWATDEGIIQDYISKAVREQTKARDCHDWQVAHTLWGWHR